MRTTFTVLLLAAILTTTACKGAPGESQSGTANGTTQAVASPESLTPEELGTLGAEVRMSPDKADEILSKRGMTRESFEAAIRKLSEDPEASKRYAAEYSKRMK